MYSIGVTYWYRYVYFDFSPQEGNICATRREHSWNNFGTWPPQKRSVFGTVSWHFMKTATNWELLRHKNGTFAFQILKSWQIWCHLHRFVPFSLASPLPYWTFIWRDYWPHPQPLPYRGGEKLPPQKRYFPPFWEKHLWNKNGTFSTFLTKTAYLCPLRPC